MSELPTTATCPWSEVQARARTGDVILFSGSQWTSELIIMLERCDFSHCGVFFVVADEQEAQRCALPRGVYMAECDFDEREDWSTGNAEFSGVQLTRDSEKRLRAYEGKVFWLPLTRSSESNLVRNQLLKPYLADLCGYCPYNANIVTWFTSGLRRHTTPTCNTRDDKGHYCISFVCEALQTMHVMAQSFNPFNVHFNTLTTPDRRTRLMTTNNVFSEIIYEIKEL